MVKLTTTEAQELAARWECSVRTIRRFKAAGVDLSNPLEIADRIASSKTCTMGQLHAALTNLKDHIESASI